MVPHALSLASPLAPPQAPGNSLHSEAPQHRRTASAEDLHHAADIAALCGLCYARAEVQEAEMAKRGLSMVAHGLTSFTKCAPVLVLLPPRPGALLAL